MKTQMTEAAFRIAIRKMLAKGAAYAQMDKYAERNGFSTSDLRAALEEA